MPITMIQLAKKIRKENNKILTHTMEIGLATPTKDSITPADPPRTYKKSFFFFLIFNFPLI